jgi:hypothetical protein
MRKTDEGRSKMSRKSPAKSSNSWDVEFVSMSLNAEQKKALQKWDTDGVQSLVCLENLVGQGWKLSISFDAANDSHICSVTSKKGMFPDKQYCLSSRGPGFVDAMRCAAYKIAVLLDYNLEGIGNSGAPRDAWD